MKRKYFKEQITTFEEWLEDARGTGGRSKSLTVPTRRSRSPSPEHKKTSKDYLTVKGGKRPTVVSVPFDENQRITAHLSLTGLDADYSDASSVFSSKSEDTVVHRNAQKSERRKTTAFISLSKPATVPTLRSVTPSPVPSIPRSSTPQRRKQVKTETVTKVTTYTTRASCEDLDHLWSAAETSSPRQRSSVGDDIYWSATKPQTAGRKGDRSRGSIKQRHSVPIETTISREETDRVQSQPVRHSVREDVDFSEYENEEKLNTLRVKSRSKSEDRRHHQGWVIETNQYRGYDHIPLSQRSHSNKLRNHVLQRSERPYFEYATPGQASPQQPLKNHTRSGSLPRSHRHAPGGIDNGQISEGYLSDSSSLRHSQPNVILGRSEVTKITEDQHFSSTSTLPRSQTLPRGQTAARQKTVREEPVKEPARDERDNPGRKNNSTFERARSLPVKATEVKNDPGAASKSRGTSRKDIVTSSSQTRHREERVQEVRRFARVSEENYIEHDTETTVDSTVESAVENSKEEKKEEKSKKKKKEKKLKKTKKSDKKEKTEKKANSEVEKESKQNSKQKQDNEHIKQEFERLAKLDSEAEQDFTLRKSYSLPYRTKSKKTTEVAKKAEEIHEVKVDESKTSVQSVEELKKTELAYDEFIKQQREILLEQINRKQSSSEAASNDTSFSYVSENELVDGQLKRANTLPVRQRPPIIHVSEVENDRTSLHNKRTEEQYITASSQQEVQGQVYELGGYQNEGRYPQDALYYDQDPVKVLPIQPLVGGQQRHTKLGGYQRHTKRAEESTEQRLKKHRQILQQTTARQQIHDPSSIPQPVRHHLPLQTKPVKNRVQFRSREGYHWQSPSNKHYWQQRAEQNSQHYHRSEESDIVNKEYLNQQQAGNHPYLQTGHHHQHSGHHHPHTGVTTAEEEDPESELVRVYARGGVIQLSLEYDNGEEFRRTHPVSEIRTRGEPTITPNGDSPTKLTYDPQSSLRVKKNSDHASTSQSEKSISQLGDIASTPTLGAFLPCQNGAFKHPNGTVYTPNTIRQLADNHQYRIVNTRDLIMVEETAKNTLVTTVTSQQVHKPEVVNYAICTHFFEPELHDNVYNIHRKGRIIVPGDLDHFETCIFYNHLYVLEEEEVFVETIVTKTEKIQAEEEALIEEEIEAVYENASTRSESSLSSHRSPSIPRRHRNPFASLKGEKIYNTMGELSDQNNNYDDEIFFDVEKSFGTTYETLRHKKRSINDELISTIPRYTPTSPGGSSGRSADYSLSLSRPRLLRKSPDFPGVGHEVEDDYPKWRPKTPESADRRYGFSLTMAQ